MLAPDNDFYQYQALAPELADRARALEAALGGPLIVYGELYGGRYGSRGDRPVQTGVDYSPDRRFIAFDVFVDGARLPVVRARAAAEAVGFQWVPEVAYGTLDRLLGLPIESEPTRVPRLFHLPDLVDNVWEGVVIWTADGAGGLIKRRTRAFGETDGRVRVRPAAVARTARVEAMLQRALPLVCRARYDGMRGKLGPCPAPQLCGMVVKDALDDMEDPDEVRRLTTVERKQLTSALNDRAVEIHASAL